MRNLKNYEKEMLNEGNTYTFAHLVLELHDEICKETEFTFHDAVNNYKARTDFNEGIYTLYGKNGVKYFFDCEMNFRGTKC
jgi:hypothetical protein